ARSELATNQAAKALADADAALAIDASDRQAADVKARAQASIAGQGQAGPAAASAAALNGEVKRFNDDVAARNAGKEAAYQAGLAQYNARVQSDAAAYAQAHADYKAQVKALDARRQADLAAWRTRVAACRHGDRSRCAVRRRSAPPPIPAHPLAPT
ncbi:MAG TPA: hypothetical protein VG166_03250, partial [Caulobacteraceae bacterium]|nr:hypothetical protein [Caulobacteraceae bacterium]